MPKACRKGDLMILSRTKKSRLALILTLVVAHPAWLEAELEEISRADFAPGDASAVRSAILDFAASDDPSNIAERMKDVRQTSE